MIMPKTEGPDFLRQLYVELNIINALNFLFHKVAVGISVVVCYNDWNKQIYCTYQRGDRKPHPLMTQRTCCARCRHGACLRDERFLGADATVSISMLFALSPRFMSIGTSFRRCLFIIFNIERQCFLSDWDIVPRVLLNHLHWFTSWEVAKHDNSFESNFEKKTI